MVSCQRGCSGNWDVRCCCELNCPKKNTNKQFYNCPMKLSTITFHLGNDYGLYTHAENNEWGPIKKVFKLTKKELDEVKKMYKEKNICE